jgi:hypothetical protein
MTVDMQRADLIETSRCNFELIPEKPVKRKHKRIPCTLPIVSNSYLHFATPESIRYLEDMGHTILNAYLHLSSSANSPNFKHAVLL